MRIEVPTRRREQFVDITAQVAEVVRSSGVSEGAVLVFVPHTTAAVTINENADPDVLTDLAVGLDRVAPQGQGYRHREGNSDGHIKTSLVGPSVLVPVSAGRMSLGTWQAIYLCEFDGPRSRGVEVTMLPGAR